MLFLQGESNAVREKGLHESGFFMGENEIYMHGNDKFAQNTLWVQQIPCIKKCTAKLPMEISRAKKSCQGQKKIHFHA